MEKKKNFKWIFVMPAPRFLQSEPETKIKSKWGDKLCNILVESLQHLVELFSLEEQKNKQLNI